MFMIVIQLQATCWASSDLRVRKVRHFTPDTST